MGCSHPRLKAFSFADGQVIKSCPDCSTFDASRSKVLRTKPEEQPTVKVSAETAVAEFLARVGTKNLRTLEALNAVDHGHDPHVTSYSGLAEDFADVAGKQTITPEAHQKAVCLIRSPDLSPEENRDRSKEIRAAKSAAKLEMRKKLYGG